jgi:hypothetical protein
MILVLRLLRTTVGMAILRFAWRRRARLIAGARRVFAATVSRIPSTRVR